MTKIEHRNANRARLLVLVVASCASAGVHAQAHEASDHVRVALISEHLSLAPGQSVQIGLLLRHEPHWHTYWINPGDSGLPTTLTWTLPPRLRTQDIAWPLPKRLDVGGLYNFGYEGEVLLPVALEVPADAKAGTTAHLAVEAKWLVCREACIPGKASLALDLPVATAPPKPDKRWTAEFARARLAQPQATAWNAESKLDGERIVITLRGPGLPDAAGIDAFVEQRKLVDNKPPRVSREGDALIVDFGKSDYFGTSPATVDLVVTKRSGPGVRGWRVQVPIAATAAP
jgi:thiol:disulfide interchange protein DsbD